VILTTSARLVCQSTRSFATIFHSAQDQLYRASTFGIIFNNPTKNHFRIANCIVSRLPHFRTSYYYHINNTEFRKQLKAFGLRFIIQVDARAGKFNFIPMLVSIGSGIGLLGKANLLLFAPKNRQVLNRSTVYIQKSSRLLLPTVYCSISPTTKSSTNISSCTQLGPAMAVLA
jgi:hypothetical protein